MNKPKKIDLAQPQNRAAAIEWIGQMLAFYYSFDYIADHLRTVPFIDRELPQAINRVRVLFGPAFKKFMQTFCSHDATLANEEMLKMSGYIDMSCQNLALVPFSRMHLAPGLLAQLAEKDMVLGWKPTGSAYTDEILQDWNLICTDGQSCSIGRLVLTAGQWRCGELAGVTHYISVKDMVGTVPKV